MFELGQSFETKDDDRKQNDGDGEYGDDARRLTRLGMFEQKPYLFLTFVARINRVFGDEDPFVLLISLKHVFAQLEEDDLLTEDVDGDVDGPAQTSARLIKVQNGVEGISIAIKVKFISQRIVVFPPLLSVTQ